jgi:Phage tail tube protein
MSALVGIDAKVEISTDGGSVWTEVPERNEFTISINVDAAEHKVFVASLADAWVEKNRTWMSWSGSLQGYYDDASDLIFDTVVAGNTIKIRFYDTRNDNSKYWQGDAILTSVEHGTTTDDFSSLSVDFEGQGALTRVS